MTGDRTREGRPRRRGTGRLRRQPGGRRNVVFVRLSDEEKEKIAARAEALGVSIQRLLVESALAGSAQTVTERRALVAELLGVRRLVAALGNNINQLARVANATGAAPPELAAAAAAVARAMARLDATVAGVSGRRS
ncbi:hypothetical protein TH66_00310 [Carbonactinospora thermoautotrophica]|uniref:Uncharacterized protein n=1 Tax=Carbonactinospora thermoautotrophica TaxID=1469144 RepID=A0A132N759_9ACTN|nr:hypothetical protein TH66_00310 [Carbonactinospora thermoautotrophica]KWX09118.1 hypothetical protein TR74_11520 [Carbonactinospora thermoautotrophica]